MREVPEKDPAVKRAANLMLVTPNIQNGEFIEQARDEQCLLKKLNTRAKKYC